MYSFIYASGGGILDGKMPENRWGVSERPRHFLGLGLGVALDPKHIIVAHALLVGAALVDVPKMITIICACLPSACPFLLGNTHCLSTTM